MEAGDEIMWSIIATAGIVTFLLRATPVFFKRINRLSDYPKVMKFLDYTICLFTGELVYSVAFRDLL